MFRGPVLATCSRQGLASWRTAKTVTSTRRRPNINCRCLASKKRKARKKVNNSVSKWSTTDGSSAASFGGGSANVIPPALLLPTASPYVFVAKGAVGSSDGEDDDDAGIDPSTLFADVMGSVDSNNQKTQGTPSSKFRAMEPHDFGGSLHPTVHTNNNKDGEPRRFAFLGRSNVGKSSLLNALMHQDLAVTSKTPGRTRKVHYYLHEGGKSNNNNNRPDFYFVDLPGYGFAVGPDPAIQDWQRRTQQFLLRQQQSPAVVHRLFLLQDARVGPQAFDQVIASWMDQAEIPYTIVLTKADGARGNANIIKHVNQVCMRFEQVVQTDDAVYQSPLVHVTSARTGLGLEELWASIDAELAI